MTTAFSSTGNFIQGRLGRDSRLLLQFSEKDLVRQRIEHSFFLVWDDGKLTQRMKAPWTAVDLAAPNWLAVEFLAIAKDGRALAIQRDGRTKEFHLWSQTKTSARGAVRLAHRVGDNVYIVGSNRQVIELHSDLTVRDLSVPDSLIKGTSDIGGFEAMDGFGPSELYACGLGGKVWYFDGRRWFETESPAKLFLSAIHCAKDGFVYVAGQDGTLLRGRERDWEIIEHGVEEYLWALAWYENELYACSMQKLFVLRDGELGILELPHHPTTFFTLDANEHALLSVGSDDVVLVRPDNVTKVV